MRHINIIIEFNADYYTAYAKNVNGIYGGGNTVANAKASIIQAIRLLKRYNGNNIPLILKGAYNFRYQFTR
jgi:hypothetical protein